MMRTSICTRMLLCLHGMRHLHQGASPPATNDATFCSATLHVFSNMVRRNTAKAFCCWEQAHTPQHLDLCCRKHKLYTYVMVSVITRLRAFWCTSSRRQAYDAVHYHHNYMYERPSMTNTDSTLIPVEYNLVPIEKVED